VFGSAFTAARCFSRSDLTTASSTLESAGSMEIGDD
jgi:hypothetical protein